MFRKSGAAHPRRRLTRRYAFLALLLLALAAPIGWVAARVPDAPYVVIFNDAAVTVPYVVAASDASFLSRASAYPAAPSAVGNDSRGVAHRRVDPDRVTSQVRDIAARNGIGEINDVYSSALGGFAARLNASQSASLAADPAVAAVIPDEEFSLDDGAAAVGEHVRTTTNPQNHIQPGIRRIGARSSGVESLTAGGVKVNADVAILDTGIQRNHPDLNVAGGYNCTGRDRNKWDDGDGHGTHVAGIVGALDNRFGVTGVAPGVRLWSVKVLDNQGHGFVSWLVCGVDWVTAQRDRGTNVPMIEVANMSLSFGGADDHACGNKNHDMLHQAICRSVDRGTVYVVAAGNDSKDVVHSRPASYDEVITVSAMADYDGRGGGHGVPSDSCPYWSSEPDDAFTSFSNYGADVDLVAPGKCILSTYFGSRYGWLSGTSMATPHVTGAAVMYLMRFPHAAPSQVRMGLEAVGTLDWRTGSDPDKSHEKAVWIGQFRAPPDFSIKTSANSGIVQPGSNLSVGVSLTRVGGFDGAITVSIDNKPPSISATPTVTRGDSTSVSIRVGPDARPGTYPITVRASAKDVVRTQTVTIIVRGAALRAAFASPHDGQTVQSAATVDVNWTHNGTAALTSSRLERQVASIHTPGSCTGASFTTESTRSVTAAVTDQLRSGLCYRWVLTLTDPAGHYSTVTSGAVLVDPTAPAS